MRSGAGGTSAGVSIQSADDDTSGNVFVAGGSVDCALAMAKTRGSFKPAGYGEAGLAVNNGGPALASVSGEDVAATVVGPS